MKHIKNVFRFLGAILSLVRGIIIIGMFFMAAMTIWCINTAYKVTIDQYNESLTWKNTGYEMPLAEIEPVLVSNVVDKNIVTAARAWEDLKNYLDALDKYPMDMKKAKNLLDEAKRWQDVYNLDSDEINRLSLYLEIEDAISEVYKTLDTGRLRELAVSLYTYEAEMPTSVGQRYVKKIAEVAEDFAKAKQTMTDTILSVGTLKDGIWTIPNDYDRDDLEEILEQLKPMEKFPSLFDGDKIISDIADVLNYNKNTKEYMAYKQFMESTESLSRSDYIAVSSVYTYEQALSYGLKVDVQNKEGYTVSLKSPVIGIYYGSDRLEDNEYIKKGATVTVWIDEIYEPISVMEPEVPQEEQERIWKDSIAEPDILEDMRQEIETGNIDLETE